MDKLIAVLLACAGGLITAGAALLHPALGLIAGGACLALWTWVVLTEG